MAFILEVERLASFSERVRTCPVVVAYEFLLFLNIFSPRVLVVRECESSESERFQW